MQEDQASERATTKARMSKAKPCKQRGQLHTGSDRSLENKYRLRSKRTSQKKQTQILCLHGLRIVRPPAQEGLREVGSDHLLPVDAGELGGNLSANFEYWLP
jgi:hypothetical protein